jgi:hypothetical protein
MAKLDDVSWYMDSSESEEDAATHIGMFVSWLIHNNLWGSHPGTDWSDSVSLVRKRSMSGRTFFLERCDGKLMSEMLTEEGAAFAEAYYLKSYLKDFQRVLGQEDKPDFVVEDTWENFDSLANVINGRHEKWKARKPWWKLW